MDELNEISNEFVQTSELVITDLISAADVSNNRSTQDIYEANFMQAKRRETLRKLDEAKFAWLHVRACIVAGIGFFTVYIFSIWSPVCFDYIYIDLNESCHLFAHIKDAYDLFIMCVIFLHYEDINHVMVVFLQENRN